MSVLVQPGSELKGRPGVIEPVTRVCSAIANFLRDRFVISTSSAEEGIALSWLRVTDSMLIQESLQLGIRPAIEIDVSLIPTNGKDYGAEEHTNQRSNPELFPRHPQPALQSRTNTSSPSSSDFLCSPPPPLGFHDPSPLSISGASQNPNPHMAMKSWIASFL